MWLNKLWVRVRRNNGAYIFNKLISFFIATGLAVLTASYKPLLQRYKLEMPEMTNTNEYNHLYWLLFLYFSFQALDELVEVYAVLAGRNKGPLGLLFELNYFMGIGILCYIGWFYQQSMHIVPEPFKALENYIGYQILLLKVVLGFVVLMFICMCCMQRDFVRKEVDDSGYKRVEEEVQ